MHFRRVTGGIRMSVTQPSTPASMEYKVAIWSLIPKIPKFLYGNPDTRCNMISPTVQIFLPGPWWFLLGPCPRGPHVVTGLQTGSHTADRRTLHRRPMHVQYTICCTRRAVKTDTTMITFAISTPVTLSTIFGSRSTTCRTSVVILLTPTWLDPAETIVSFFVWDSGAATSAAT